MVDELIHTLESTMNFIKQLVADLSEQQMVEQPTGVPNHATWTLGHIIFSCQGIAIELGEKEWLPADWESAFGYGSIPHPNLRRYPKKSELLSILGEAQNRLSQSLLATDQSVLESTLPDKLFPTMSHLVLQVVIAHTAYHTGQLAMWRRAIGMQPVGVFI
jgi:hypothetical protein